MDNNKNIIRELKRIRNYFGEHSKTQFEHWAYWYLDRHIKQMGEMDNREKPENSILSLGIEPFNIAYKNE